MGDKADLGGDPGGSPVKNEKEVAHQLDMHMHDTISPSYFRRLAAGGEFELTIRCFVKGTTIHKDAHGRTRAESVAVRSLRLAASPKKIHDVGGGGRHSKAPSPEPSPKDPNA